MVEMNPFEEVRKLFPYRILSKYREAKMIMDGEMPPPRFVDLYPVYGCNHNCIGCDYGELNMKPKILSPKNFRNIIYSLDSIGCETIDYCGGGEPTLNDYLPDMIRLWCEEFNHTVGLLTNGTRMNGRLMEAVIDNAAYVRFSLESATKETFHKYKRPKNESYSDWDTVMVNLKETIKYRNETASKCLIGYKFTIDQNNIVDIPKAFELAKELGVDSLQFKLIRNVPSELEPSLLPLVKSQVEELGRSNPEVNVVCGLDGYEFKGGCWMNPLWPTVDANGDMWICCYYRHRMKDHLIGNIIKDNITDVWYSEEHMQKIAKINKKECCKYDCRFMKYNDFMKEVVLEGKGQVDFV